jgi:hypothetical protein
MTMRESAIEFKGSGGLRPGSNENFDPPLSAHVLAMQVGVAP